VSAFSGAAAKDTTMSLKSLFGFVNRWRRYEVSMRELAMLSDRELADIGITRSDIPRIARQNARG
jgi:uncharacterized protein YjiS (DUF1127 family)